jgi:hypothetical protein
VQQKPERRCKSKKEDEKAETKNSSLSGGPTAEIAAAGFNSRN